MDIRVAGENALIIYLGDSIRPQVSAQVSQLVRALERHCQAEIIDLIPSYHSIVVVYDPRTINYRTLKQKILTLELSQEPANSAAKRLELPVYYSPESGPDLARIAEQHKLSIEDVIRIHTAGEYRVYAIGFAPGFAYLGEVDQRIATPRLDTPRLKVPAGAVAIADSQTAVYPAESPGGWNLIGRCPTPMFDASASPPMAFGVGDLIRFTPISRSEFLQLGGEL